MKPEVRAEAKVIQLHPSMVVQDFRTPAQTLAAGIANLLPYLLIAAVVGLVCSAVIHSHLEAEGSAPACASER